MTISITLNNVSNLTDTVTAQSVINTNSNTITQAFTSALDVTGDQMSGNLDMNSNHILNLPTPSSANEPARLADVTSTSISVALPHLTGVVTSTTGVGTVVTTFSGSGNLPIAQLAGGSGATNTTFLRGDGTWAGVASASVTAGTGINVGTAIPASISINSTVVSGIVSDVNVLGSIATNVLSIGWTGALGIARGGAGNVLTASAGGQVFSNATGLAISTGATTTGQIWLSVVTGTPVLSTSVWPATCTVNTILFASATSTWAATSTITQLTITTSTLATPTLTTPTISGTTVLANATMSGSLTFSTGTIGIVGCTDTSNGAAGVVGELISTTISAASALALANATASVVMGISLTAGDWDVYAQHVFTTGTATTQISLLGGSINSTAAFNAVAGAFSQQLYPTTTPMSAAGNIAFWTGPFRVSQTATATIQNIMQANFATGSVSAWGALRARRIR